MTEVIVDYDSSWKQGLEDYLQEALALMFPEIHSLIDWEIPPESKEQELQQIAKEAQLKKHITDKLFKVYLKGKKEVWILIHIEIQSQEDKEFAQRMWIYHYRLSDRYQVPIINLGVLGDKRKAWRPSSYQYEFGGCEVVFKFPVVKLRDFEEEQAWKSLEESNNPFAVFIMAHLKTLSTYKKMEQRKQWKWNLVRGLFEKGYSREEIQKLFRLVDWLMALPKELEEEWLTQVMEYQQEVKMPLLSHLEIRAKEQGIQEGLQQGIQEGLQQGIQEGLQQGIQEGLQQGSLQVLQENIINVLEMRFESINPQLKESLNNLKDIPQLKQLFRRALEVNSLSEFQELL